MRLIYGLTIEGTDDTEDGVGINLSKLLGVLAELPRKPTLRLCMEFGIEPEAYLHYVKTIRNAGYPIMLQPVDSQDMHRYSPQGYVNRMVKSSNVLAAYFDYLEVGNEVNGDWCGSQVDYKWKEALRRTTGRHLESVLTIYVTHGYEAYGKQAGQASFLNYLFYSLYPNSEKEALQFIEAPYFLLKENIKYGIGEYGVENADGNHKDFGAKVALVTQVENLGFDGGFYWDFYDDCVKNDTGLLEIFKSVWA